MSVNQIDVNAVNERTRKAGCDCDRCKKTISEIIKNDHGKPATTDKTNL